MKKVLVSIPLILGVVFPLTAQAVCCKCVNPTAPKANICINTTTITDCSTLKTASLNASIKPLDCQAFPTGVVDSQCKPVANGGVCATGPIDELKYGPSGASASDVATIPAEPPTLGIPIPNLTFTSNLPVQGGFIEVPWLAQYIVAVQAYLIGISVVAAAVMIVYGGFLYIVGASGAKITSGKKIIADAVIGLVLIFGSYLILSTINPATVTLDAIRIRTIDPKYVGNYDPTVPIEKDPSAPAELKSTNTGTQAGFDPKQLALAAKYGIKVDDGIFDDIIKGAKAAGLDACLMLANCEHETRFIPSWQGWYVGSPKEKATHFGACGMTAGYLAPGGPYYDRLRKQFPDFPDLPPGKLTKENMLRIGDWLMTNHVGDAYAASLMMLDNFKILKNEVQGVAAFKAGTLSMQKNAAAMNCTPKTGLLFKAALANAQQALKDSCVAHFVAIPSLGDPPMGCPEDKYLCTDPKPGKNSSWVGHCSDGRTCYAMLADESVTFIMDEYPKLKQAHPSCQ